MIEIKNKFMSIPIIQGGMGVGISLGGLAGSVAACGGMGVISAANPGYRSEFFWQDPDRANREALEREILKAKEIAGGCGMVAVNVMVAAKNFALCVKTAIAAGADAIISGAGLPTELPDLAAGADIALAPIVSSGKAARTICKLWDRNHGTCPDFVVVEGSEAGGHLGFKSEELQNSTAQSLGEILTSVLEEIEPFAKKYLKKIPVFAAGGIFCGEQIAEYMNAGAAGVQIGTPFIATHECDAAESYKQAVIDAEHSVLVKSPVGMPGRALHSTLIQKLERDGKIPITRCIDCLHPCNPATAPYCISRALISAAEGNLEEGLIFSGAQVGRIHEKVHAKDLIARLMAETAEAEKNI